MQPEMITSTGRTCGRVEMWANQIVPPGRSRSPFHHESVILTCAAVDATWFFSFQILNSSFFIGAERPVPSGALRLRPTGSVGLRSGLQAQLRDCGASALGQIRTADLRFRKPSLYPY